MRDVPKELESGRARTNHGCGSGLPAGDLALGATPAGQGDAGAGFVSFGPCGLGGALVRRTHCTAQKSMFVSIAGVCRVSVGQSKTGYHLSGSGPAASVKTRGPRRAGFGAVGGQNQRFMLFRLFRLLLFSFPWARSPFRTGVQGRVAGDPPPTMAATGRALICSSSSDVKTRAVVP